MYRHMADAQQQEEEELSELALPALPSYVEYEHIRHLIPRGHALVGVSGEGIETKDDYIRALLWIVGGSGSGKTNSTLIRIDDDIRRGHQLMGVDPHAGKPDSLPNALRGYEQFFRLPIARELSDIDVVLDTFLEEFYGRRDHGWPLFPPITLVVDEVDTLTVGIEREEKLAMSVMNKMKKIARICGQESRDFNLLSILISHNAAGLSWLRRDAVMVLAHQVLQFEERMRVCNQDREMARSMDNWPRGRTYVYGIAFEDGPLLVQQPVVKTRVVDANQRMPDLPQKQPERTQELTGTMRAGHAKQPECARELTGTANDENVFLPLTLQKFLHEAARKYANGEASINDILREGGLSPGGRNNQNLKMLLDGMATQE
jgi:hypothetical protein